MDLGGIAVQDPAESHKNDQTRDDKGADHTQSTDPGGGFHTIQIGEGAAPVNHQHHRKGVDFIVGQFW